MKASVRERAVAPSAGKRAGVYRSIQGAVAVVTGGGQGIGRATVGRLVAEGAKVVIADIAESFGRDAVAELNRDGRVAAYVNVDVSDDVGVAAMASAAVEEFGGIDLLVNGAAAFIMRGLEATVAEWRRIMDVNIMGGALCAKHVVPHMHRRGKGAIVNIASISGHVGQAGYLTYNATKAAVANMTRCLAIDLAPHNIRVNAVNPGTVWNANNERYHREVLGLSREQADRHAAIGGKHILGRTADPEEIAAAIIFLLSDDASFITGENLMVDGGYTAI